MDKRVGKTYDDLFQSLGIAICTCTLLVTIGKLISCYYFVYIVIGSVLIITTLSYYDYKEWQELNTNKSCCYTNHDNNNNNGGNSGNCSHHDNEKKSFHGKSLTPSKTLKHAKVTSTISTDSYFTSGGGPRKRMKEFDRFHSINERHYYGSDESDTNKGSNSSPKDTTIFLKAKEKLVTFFGKEGPSTVGASSTGAGIIVENNNRLKEEQKIGYETLV